MLCNGPGTCVPLCAAGLILGVLGLKRVLIVYVESICRVKTLSIREDPLLLFWLLFCAVGTTKRQIPKGHLLRETGVIPFCRRLYWDFHAILILFFTCDSFLCCYWRAVNTTMTTISEFSFFKPSDHGRLIRFLFYRLRLWKVNETKPREVFFTHAGASSCIPSLFFTSWTTVFGFWSVQDYTVIRINARLVLKIDCNTSFLSVNTFFLSVVVKYFPAHYAFQYFFVLLCWYVVLGNSVKNRTNRWKSYNSQL